VCDKTHHAPSLISAEGEFPSDKDIGLPLSDEADIFYKADSSTKCNFE
jgi:hypothetical protein